MRLFEKQPQPRNPQVDIAHILTGPPVPGKRSPRFHTRAASIALGGHARGDATLPSMLGSGQRLPIPCKSTRFKRLMSNTLSSSRLGVVGNISNSHGFMYEPVGLRNESLDATTTKHCVRSMLVLPLQHESFVRREADGTLPLRVMHDG